MGGDRALSLLQEQFCLAYIRNGGDARAAYLETHPNVKGASAKRCGCMWLKDPNIASRIAELRDEVVEREKISIDDMVREFAHDRDLARQNGQISAAVKANESIAKLLGLWVDKSETTVSMRPEDARKTVEQLVAKYLPGASQ